MLATVLPAFRPANSWAESVRATYEAMFAFGIEEPEYTQLGAVEALLIPGLRGDQVKSKKPTSARSRRATNGEGPAGPGHGPPGRRGPRGLRRRDSRRGAQPRHLEGRRGAGPAGRPAGVRRGHLPRRLRPPDRSRRTPLARHREGRPHRA